MELSSIVATPFWSALGARRGHRPMLIRALPALGVCQWLAALTTNVWLLIGIRVLQGALAGFIAAAQAYATAGSSGANRGQVLARLQSATAIGSMLGPVSGGLLMDLYGFAWICLIAGLICLACVVPVLSLPKDTPEPAAPVGTGTTRRITSYHWLLAPLVVITLVQAAKMMPQPFFALYLNEVLHAPSWLSGASYAASALTLALSAPWWARLCAPQPVQRGWQFLEVASWASALTLCLMALAHDTITFIATRLLWGLWQGALLPLAYVLIGHTAPNAYRAIGQGLGNSAAKVGALAGLALGAGAMPWASLHWGFWLVAPVYVVAALSVRFLRQLPGCRQPLPTPPDPLATPSPSQIKDSP
ncbi:MFS transporter [Achromobacter pulmonis]|uniref:MFS transporter n=1 Tax=Achromobacter pulmonis TaxID=1389932 RepID=UPI001EEDAFD1|nr:MFS transporter [Achromobacter pulmonis]